MEELISNIVASVAHDLFDDCDHSILSIIQPNAYSREPVLDDDDLDLFIFSRLMKGSTAKKRKPNDKDDNQNAKNTPIIPSIAELNDDNAHHPPSPPKSGAFVTFLQHNLGSSFAQHFKMTKTTFEIMHHLISPWLRSQLFTTQHVCLMSLWILTGSEPIASVADRFGAPLIDCLQSFNQFCRAIVENRHQFIRWPTSAESNEIVNSFNELTGEDGLVFPNISGVLGSIELPQKITTEPQRNVHTKLQCVSDSRGLFLDCFVATEAMASKNNFCVFRASPLCQERLQTNGEHNMRTDVHMIADRSYPLSRFVMVPFKDRTGHLSDAQKQFNWNLSVRKRIVDIALHRLCKRFERLQHMGQYVTVACALHNLCIEHGDSYEWSDGLDCDEIRDGGDTAQKRETCHDVVVDAQVETKRNEILQRIEQQLTIQD